MHEFEIFSWLESIGDCLSYKPSIQVWIGFSFFAKDENSELIYIYAVRQLCSYQFQFYSKSQYAGFLQIFKNIGLDELLHTTFISQREENPFWKSGFRPFKLVSNYVWLRK